MGRIADVAGAMVIVAGITTIVTHQASADVIKAIGAAFSNALLASQGINH